MQNKVIVVTIDEEGTNTFLKTDATDCFLELGAVVTRRASHVEPGPRYERWLFSLLRTLFSDTSKVAAWTRTLNTLWRVNTSPVGGPILTWGNIWDAQGTTADLPMVKGLSQYNCTAYFSKRQAAIDAEIVFLNQFFAERKIS